MSELPAKADQPQIGSAIHLEFIRTVVDAGSPTGIEEVEAFHRALFLHEHGKDLERFQQERRIREDRLVALESQLNRTTEKLNGEVKLLPAMEDGQPDTHPNAPWNLWDRTMFTIAGVAVVCLLAFGIFNISFNLLESGIVTFSEHPIRAYLWAALLPVGALAVKVGWDFLKVRWKRDLYVWTCLIIGVAAVMVWVGAYSSVYPTLSKTVEDDIARLSVFDQEGRSDDYFSSLTSGGVKRVDMIIVASQAVAEICLSAALGIFMTSLYSKHRPVRLANNPAFMQLDDDRRSLEERVSRERLALAEARGGEMRLENQLTVFVTYAKSLFQRETAQRKDSSHQKRLLIEEMAEQLRSRLEAVDAEGERRNGGSIRTLTSTGEAAR